MPQQQIDPATGERVASPSTLSIDPSTGERASSSPAQEPPSALGELVDMGKMGASLVFGQLLGADPHFAYLHHDDIKQKLSEVSSDFSKRMDKASTVNDDPISLAMRKQVPAPFESHDTLENFVHSASEFIADPVMYGPAVLGAMAGPRGARIGADVGFAADAGLRKMLTDHYQKGDAKSFGELASRTASTMWAATKGALTGEAMTLSAELPLGPLAGIPGVSTAVRGAYQAAAMEITGKLLDGQMPTFEGFKNNAVTVAGFNIIMHGASIGVPEAKQGLMDVYAKDGTTPEQSATKLQAQPPVKPEPPEGLKPAIRLTAKDGSTQVITGEPGETHAELAQRVTGVRPTSIEELDADPKLADKVLSQPEVQDQSVIDRAMELKSEEPPPIRAYHGTESEFEGPPKVDGLGAHFSTDKSVAESHTMEKGKAARVIESELNIKNPIRVKDHGGSHSNATSTIKSLVEQGAIPESFAEGLDDRLISRFDELKASGVPDSEAWDTANNEELSKVKKHLTDKGYDGLVYKNKVEGGGDSYVAFNQDQISASIGGPDENSYFKRPTEPPKSGRGFSSGDGQYMNRKQSQKWVKENQPDVHDMWAEITGDDKAEFHSQDYKEASDRVAGRTVLEGEDAYSSMSPDNAERIAAFRSDLNDERLQESPNKYGETLRSFITGQRDMRTTVASNLRLEIRKALPDEVDREALTFMRDFKSDPKALQERLAAINNRDAGALGITDTEHQEEILYRLQKTAPAIEKALNPTPKMQAMDAELTKYATSTLEEARGLGILDSTIPPEQYITHILREADEEAGGAKLPRPKLSRSTPYAQERKYPTTLDAMVANKVSRTLDAADAIAVYGDRHATAAATRMFVTELKNSELGKWGTSKDVPSDWRKLGEGRVFEYVGVDKDGNNFSTSFYAPKDIVDSIKPITERKTIFQGPVAQKFRRFQSYIKSADMALSVFHMKALTISAMNNMSYANFVRSMQTSINTPEFGRMAEGWAADGLVTTRSRISSDVYEGLTALPSKASIADSVVGIKQAKEAARAITHATFDVMQTRYKVTDAASKDAAWLAKHPEASEQEHFAARRAIAKEVNAVYGGLNWENMGLGANQVELMRAFILAPDWTISNLANLKYTLEGGAGGKAARMFWFKSISTGLALTQLTSLAITGQTSKNLTQVYLGKDKDGKEMYSSWFFAGAPKDLATWINSVGNNGGLTGTALFITNKLAPLAGIPPRLIMNKDWSGRPITKPKQGALEKTGRQAAFAAQQVLPAPFALKDAAQMLMDPDKDYTKWDFINTIAGSTTIHEGDNKKTQGSSRSRKGFHLAGAR